MDFLKQPARLILCILKRGDGLVRAKQGEKEWHSDKGVPGSHGAVRTASIGATAFQSTEPS